MLSHSLRTLLWGFSRTASRGRPRTGAFPRRLFRPRVDLLEDRWLLSTFTVTTTADSGDHSLRQAILDANAAPDASTITFNIQDGQMLHTILVGQQTQTALPFITNPAGLVIDATTQPGYQGRRWS